MDINIIFKVGAIGLIIAIFTQILSQTKREEQAMFITIAGVIVVMAIILSMLNQLFNEVRTMFNIYWEENKMLLVKIIFIAVIAIVLSILISKVNEEYKLYFILIFGIVAILMILSELKGPIGNMFNIFKNYNIKIDNFSLLLKIVGIAYVCDFVSLICKDLDYESIGKKIEMSGKLIILVYSFNVILKFIDEVYLLVNR